MDRFDVVVIGAGAAGMMCAIEAGKRGRSVLVLDHAAKAGEKIRGTERTTNLWDELTSGAYVSDAYVNTGSDGQVAPTCK